MRSFHSMKYQILSGGSPAPQRPLHRRSRKSQCRRSHAFVAERGYTLPIAVDVGASAQRYGIWNFPQSVLLDRDCRLAWLSQDGEMPSPAQLKHLLDDIDTFPAH